MIELVTIDKNNISIKGSLTRFDDMQLLQLPQNEQELTVDISQMQIDTAGLAWLLKQTVQLTANSCNLVWSNPSKDISDLALISGVNDILGF